MSCHWIIPSSKHSHDSNSQCCSKRPKNQIERFGKGSQFEYETASEYYQLLTLHSINFAWPHLLVCNATLLYFTLLSVLSLTLQAMWLVSRRAVHKHGNSAPREDADTTGQEEGGGRAGGGCETIIYCDGIMYVVGFFFLLSLFFS
jgi:hypothetical protein